MVFLLPTATVLGEEVHFRNGQSDESQSLLPCARFAPLSESETVSSEALLRFVVGPGASCFEFVAIFDLLN